MRRIKVIIALRLLLHYDRTGEAAASAPTAGAKCKKPSLGATWWRLKRSLLVLDITAGSPAVLMRPHLSDRRKGQMSGTGGVAGRSFASAMMCSKVMSVWVQTSVTRTSCDAPAAGVRRRTWTTMGSRRMASATVPSWSTLENSRAFTCGKEKSIFLESAIIHASNYDSLGK